MDIPWSYINKFYPDTEYQIQLKYDEPKYYPLNEEDKYPAEIWMYGGQMVYPVEKAEYYDGQEKRNATGLSESEPVRFRAKKSLHDQIQRCNLRKGDVVIIEKISMGQKSFIKVKNEPKEPSRDINDSPGDASKSTSDDWDVAEAPQSDSKPSLGYLKKQRSIVFQACLKCASMALTDKPAVDIIAFANELFVAHDVFVSELDDVVEDYSNDPQEAKEPKLIEKVYSAFKLPYPDKTPQAETMLTIINGWLMAYNTNREEKVEKFETLEERILKVANMADLYWLQEEVKKNIENNNKI